MSRLTDRIQQNLRKNRTVTVMFVDNILPRVIKANHPNVLFVYFMFNFRLL